MVANEITSPHKHHINLKVVLPFIIIGLISVTALVISTLTIFLFRRSGGPTGKQGDKGPQGPQGPQGPIGKDASSAKDAFFTCPSTGEAPMNVDYGQSKGNTEWKSVPIAEMQDWFGSNSEYKEGNCQRYCNVNDNCAAYYWDPDTNQCFATSELTDKDYDSVRGIEVHCSGDAPKGLNKTGSWKNKYNPKYSIDGNDCNTTCILSEADQKKELGGSSPENTAWINSYAIPNSKCTSERKTFSIPSPKPWCYTSSPPPSVITPAPWGYVSDSQDCL